MVISRMSTQTHKPSLRTSHWNLHSTWTFPASLAKFSIRKRNIPNMWGRCLYSCFMRDPKPMVFRKKKLYQVPGSISAQYFPWSISHKHLRVFLETSSINGWFPRKRRSSRKVGHLTMGLMVFFYSFSCGFLQMLSHNQNHTSMMSSNQNP